ncbi:DUF6708 domain-containing protein [Luteimonas salinilitoris]|uniref:DUF6708 domain-containing protein n=1 Tax=Luteimonas salinilitoris TaxID=3237697 RepID=A0ABV4HLI6_9GAMM
MLTGWTKPFKIDRLLSTEERQAALPHHRQPGVRPDPYDGLIHFNSTYADFIDRSFRLRGMANTAFGLFGTALLLGILFYTVIFFFPKNYRDGVIDEAFLLISSGIMSVLILGSVYIFWRFHFRKDLFACTHYPIRFNRKTGNVHVFRHNGPGGVLTVPWGEAFWHVGRGYQQKFLCDVRGHVLEGDMVRDTFAVGHYFDDSRMSRIQSIWEFIRRYMEEGPETVAEHPLDRLIHESTKPTLKNCFIHVYASMGPNFIALRYFLFFLFFPSVWVLTLTRWLVLNSCKEPMWPPEVEMESRIEPGDPHRWEEPSYINEFANRPGVFERYEERMRQEERMRDRSSR